MKFPTKRDKAFEQLNRIPRAYELLEIIEDATNELEFNYDWGNNESNLFAPHAEKIIEYAEANLRRKVKELVKLIQ